MAHARIERSGWREVGQPSAPFHCCRYGRTCLVMLVEISGGGLAWSIRDRQSSVCRRGGSLIWLPPAPLELVGRTGRRSWFPVARHAGAASPFRSRASTSDDVGWFASAEARHARLSRSGATSRRAGMSCLLIAWAGLRICLRGKLHHHAPALQISKILAPCRGAAGRPLR